MTDEEKANRISRITDFYLCRLGRAQIGIFNLPTAEPNPLWFPVFINTLMVTLRRRNIMPYFFWVHDLTAKRYVLVLWGSGYFRNDCLDIARIVEHVWAFHSPEPAVLLRSFSLSTESTVEDRLLFTRIASDLVPLPPSPELWHKHTFGNSQIR